MVNGWDGDAKLKLIKVRLTVRAQSVFQRLPATSMDTFDHTVHALQERFKPPSKREVGARSFRKAGLSWQTT